RFSGAHLDLHTSSVRTRSLLCSRGVCPRDGDQVGAEPEQRGLAFDRTRREQDRLPALGGRETVREVAEPMRDPLDADELYEREPG
ncbi:MAG TPA: hypothetical protein VIK61_04705, partial [Acidimicrobiia bacterium]